VQGSFDPKLIQRYQRRFPGFDEKIVSMYARGMTVREIQGHLLEIYGLEVSPDLISTVTDAVLETVAEWQNRPLEAMYPLVFFDALRVKIRDEGLVRNKAVYVALGVRPEIPSIYERYSGWDIEQTFGKMKRFKRLMLRREKTARNFATTIVALTCAFILIKSVHTA
jgi:Transposase, Mutator family